MCVVGEAIKLRCQLERDRYSYTDVTLYADKCTARPFVLIACRDISEDTLHSLYSHKIINKRLAIEFDNKLTFIYYCQVKNMDILFTSID